MVIVAMAMAMVALSIATRHRYARAPRIFPFAQDWNLMANSVPVSVGTGRICQ